MAVGLKFCAGAADISKLATQVAMENFLSDIRIGMFESSWAIQTKRARETVATQASNDLILPPPVHDMLKVRGMHRTGRLLADSKMGIRISLTATRARMG